jgi:hypothetical protein
VASYTKSILPGGEGKITLKVETHGYSGRIAKAAQVYSNDPGEKVVNIALEATIQQLLSLTPSTIFLAGQSGQTAVGFVMIRAETDRPLHLQPVRFDLQDKVNYSLEEVEPGRLYRVQFSSVPGLSGIVAGNLSLKTNYPEKPEVTIRIRGKFKN